MQNREDLRQKGHDGSRKTTCRERGKKYHFQKGGGNKSFSDRNIDPWLQIHILFIRIWILLFTLIPIRIQILLFTLIPIRIRILLFNLIWIRLFEYESGSLLFQRGNVPKTVPTFQTSLLDFPCQ